MLAMFIVPSLQTTWPAIASHHSTLTSLSCPDASLSCYDYSQLSQCIHLTSLNLSNIHIMEPEKGTQQQMKAVMSTITCVRGRFCWDGMGCAVLCCAVLFSFAAGTCTCPCHAHLAVSSRISHHTRHLSSPYLA